MDRTRDLPTWPLAEASRFVRHGTNDWHVQEMGEGPLLLLLHGAGGSTHTWRDIAPPLARHFRIVALDLPGQGFTRAGTLSRTGLAHMTEDIAALCAAENWRPAAVVGHSAGAAIALALAERLQGPPAVVGINAALSNFQGVASWLFPLLARLLAMNPFTATLFSFGGPNAARAKRLIEGTGSHIDAPGLDCYARLLADRGHVDATLQMMTRWDIDPLVARLGELPARTLFIVGTGDTAVPPEASDSAAARMKNAEVVRLADRGHLCHEESPDRTVDAIEAFLLPDRDPA